MTNYNRYTYGFILGLLAEYLVRVNFNIFALIALISILLIVILDLFYNNFLVLMGDWNKEFIRLLIRKIGIRRAIWKLIRMERDTLKTYSAKGWSALGAVNDFLKKQNDRKNSNTTDRDTES